jgi:hypothetical protein
MLAAARRSPPCSPVLRASAPTVSLFASAPIDARELRGRAAPWRGAPRREFPVGQSPAGGGRPDGVPGERGSVDATRHEDDKLGTRVHARPMIRRHARAPARLGPVGISLLGRAPRPRSLDRIRKRPSRAGHRESLAVGAARQCCLSGNEIGIGRVRVRGRVSARAYARARACARACLRPALARHLDDLFSISLQNDLCSCMTYYKDSRFCLYSRGESGWCLDVTSTHGVWRHAGVQFLLSGVPLGRPAARRRDNGLHGVTVSTLDSKSSDCGSNPREAFAIATNLEDRISRPSFSGGNL